MPPEDGGAIRGSLPTVRNDRLCAGSESTLESEERGTETPSDDRRYGLHHYKNARARVLIGTFFRLTLGPKERGTDCHTRLRPGSQ